METKGLYTISNNLFNTIDNFINKKTAWVPSIQKGYNSLNMRPAQSLPLTDGDGRPGALRFWQGDVGEDRRWESLENHLMLFVSFAWAHLIRVVRERCEEKKRGDSK